MEVKTKKSIKARFRMVRRGQRTWYV